MTSVMKVCIAVMAALSLLAVTLMVYMDAQLYDGPSYDSESFVRRRWHESTARERGSMSGDLVDSHLLVGLSRKALASLIGPAMKVVPPYQYGTPATGAVEAHVYYLGSFVPGIGGSDAFLVVYLSGDGRVLGSKLCGV